MKLINKLRIRFCLLRLSSSYKEIDDFILRVIEKIKKGEARVSSKFCGIIIKIGNDTYELWGANLPYSWLSDCFLNNSLIWSSKMPSRIVSDMFFDCINELVNWEDIDERTPLKALHNLP